jgi:hypothetical protein
LFAAGFVVWCWFFLLVFRLPLLVACWLLAGLWFCIVSDVDVILLVLVFGPKISDSSVYSPVTSSSFIAVG